MPRSGVFRTRPSAEALRHAAGLDQYYTQRPVAAGCWDLLSTALNAHGVPLTRCTVLEPSAGDGAFVDTAPAGAQIVARDLAPARPDIGAANFLTDKQAPWNPNAPWRLVVGNPPFGRKASLANAFIARAAEHRAHLVAFVLPLQFRKWSAQSRVPAGWRLIADHDLPEEAFELLGAAYRVRCSFQIWAAPSFPEHPDWPDRRLTGKPPTEHPDFTAYQFNRTPEAEKYFHRAWDFAVPRQGYVDYAHKAYRAEDCNRKQQWIFFKAHSARALRVLLALDFEALSRKNIGTPGFGKADVVEAYGRALALEPQE